MNNTECEAEYFSNWMCGNPPPVYPSMAYTAVKAGCRQCSRSEAALPVGGTTTTSSGATKCEPCPEQWVSSGAAKCESGRVVQQKGWWRAAEQAGGLVTNKTKFWECYTHEKACIGSAFGESFALSQCAEGHTGPVCALCKPGSAMVHSKCTKCPPGAWAAIGSAAAFAVCSIGSIAALYYNRKRLGMTSKASSIKIVIGFYSLLAVLEQTFAIAWPAGFERTLSNLKAAFASVLDFSSISCAVKADWFQRVAFLCLALIAVLVALAVAFARAVSKARVAARDATEGELVPLAHQPNRKGKVTFLLGKLFGVDRPPELDVEYSGKAFNVMLLMYPFLSPAVIAIFNCREVAGEFGALYP
jgi:hypothetical protein